MVEEMRGSEVNDRFTSLPIFTCKKCSNLLKLPIILVNGTGNVCGVCSETYNHNLRTRNEALELVLKSLILPCRYKKNGCPKNLTYSEIDDHELVCNHRLLICPLKALRNCNETPSLSQIKDHFTKYHENEILFKPRLEFKMDVDIAKNSEWINLLHDYNNLFILHLRYNIDISILRCTLYQIKTEKGFLESNYTVTYKDRCYIGNVNTLAEDKVFKGYFDADQVLDINLSKDSKTAIDIYVEINDKNITSPTTDDRILEIMECPICNYYMKLPIHQCLTGHSVCNVCKVKLYNCPTCKDRFGETRNYSLERIANYLNFPCMYRDEGCNVTETAHRITTHEQECPLQVYRCPTSYGCTWTGIYDNMLDHVSTHFPTTKCSYYLGKLNPNYENFFFHMIAYDRLFYASIGFVLENEFGTGCQASSFWDVRLIGRKNEAKLFKYEFGLIRSSPIDEKLTFSNTCHEFTGKLHDTYFEIPEAILHHFKVNGEISFYCRIVKIVETEQKQVLHKWLVKNESIRGVFPQNNHVNYNNQSSI